MEGEEEGFYTFHLEIEDTLEQYARLYSQREYPGDYTFVWDIK